MSGLRLWAGLALVLCFAASSRAKSVVGVWNVKGRECVKMPGMRECGNFRDIFTYEEDGTFKTIETDEGTWEQKKKRVTSEFDKDEIEDVFESYLGLPCTVKYWRLKAKMSGSSRLKRGKIKGLVYLDLRGRDKVPVRIRISGTWSGTKVTSSDGGGLPSPVDGAILEAVKASVADVR